MGEGGSTQCAATESRQMTIRQPAETLLEGLSRPLNEKMVPVEFLYDARGSALYERITETEEYYLFETELNLLRKFADNIIGHVAPSAIIVELGCGTARKTGSIVNAVIRRDGYCRFAGIDVSRVYLEKARSNLLAFCPGLRCDQVELVEASYLDGVEEVRRRHPESLLCLLWLGSSVGNMNSSECEEFFKQMVSCSQPKMQIILCVDYWKDTMALYKAYKDPKGVTEAFIKNGMRNALSSFGYVATEKEEAAWEYEVVINEQSRTVEMWIRFPSGLSVVCPKAQTACVCIAPQERVLMEISRKFTVDDVFSLASACNMLVQESWGASAYGIHVLLTAAEAMSRSWADTDEFFFRRLFCNWHDKPISLRHPFIFYYGHNIAFTKTHVVPEERSSPLDIMFGRGINPLCTNQDVCHPHSPVPKEWPSKSVVIAYVSSTRNTVLRALARGSPNMPTVAMSLEHERMHQETLCYMLAQVRRVQFESQLAVASKQKKAEGISASLHGNGRASVTQMASCRWNEEQPLLSTNMFSPVMRTTLPFTVKCLSLEEPLSSQNGGMKPQPGTKLPQVVSDGPCNDNIDRLNKRESKIAKPAAKDFVESEISIRLPEVLISAGPVCLGEESLPGRFLWDNECPRMHTEVVKPFLVATRPVTVAEFREFVLHARGYHRPEFWDQHDYALFRAKGHNHPATWTAVVRTDVGQSSGNYHSFCSPIQQEDLDLRKHSGLKASSDGPINGSSLDEPAYAKCKHNTSELVEDDSSGCGAGVGSTSINEVHRRTNKNEEGGDSESSIGVLSKGDATALDSGGLTSSRAGPPLPRGKYKVYVESDARAGEREEAIMDAAESDKDEMEDGESGLVQHIDFFVHDDVGTYHWTQVADRPVYVSLSEAMAFCAWAGCRIMTESQYVRIISSLETTEYAETNTVKDLQGNGWEWTSTLFGPFPGFVPTDGYSEYSTDFFDGNHYVLKGASPCTHSSMRRRSFRNFYQRQYPYVFAKFRLCSDCPSRS